MWDIIVITASNSNQAEIYNHYIKSKLVTGLLDNGVEYKVITDDSDKRIGSGGATLSVINKLSKEYDIENKKILLVHSGGDSKRIPQYSATGKLFSPVLKCNEDGTAETLFDELLKNVCRVPEVCGNGLLVMSGDVLVTFDGIDKESFKADAVALTAKAPATEGTHHGVICSENGIVKHFLHKCSIDVLEEKGAVSDGKVDIDTGAVFLSGKIVADLKKLVADKENYEQFVNDKVRLNFYGDFLFPLAAQSTLEDYLVQGCEFDSVNDEIIECRKILWNMLKGYSMSNCQLINGRFIHFGTTPQLIELIKNNDLGWEKSVLCNRTDILAYNSYVSEGADVNGYVENAVIRSNVHTGANSVVSGAYLNYGSVPENTVVSVLRLTDGRFCMRAYPIDCNPKENNLWEAEIFPVFEDYKACGQMLEHFINKDEVYNSCEKMSFKDSFANSSANVEMEKEIKKYRRNYYLNEIKRNIAKYDFELNKEQAECRLPLRVNFGGGWTDTSPYANEFGGKVLNAAVMLDNRLPVSCVVRKVDKKAFVLTSRDLGTQKIVTDIEDMTVFDLKDNDFLIHKAVCLACGLINEDTDLNEFFDTYGGIEIITGVENVPKGSGLGTSSILCAATADAMYQFMGIETDTQKVMDTVLTMEQLMKTGGGWQDQVGGYVKGFKLTTSPKGTFQKLTIKQLNVSEKFMKEISERYILIYTGQKRLARNLLATVLDNIYNRDECFAVMSRIKVLADEMTEAIETDDVDRFAELLNEHWICSNILDEGTSNANIESIHNAIKEYTDGFFISGAGGGGFLQVILKKDSSVEDINRALANANVNEDVKIYNVSFCM